MPNSDQKIDTARGAAGDCSARDPANKEKRKPGETPRDKPVEEEADKDIRT